MNFGCYSRHYGDAVRAKGIAGAFADLKARYEASPYVKSQCHQLAHVIGRAAAAKFTSVGEAFEQGDSFCWSGYYHGILEGFSERIGRQNITKEMDHLCESIPGKEEKTFNYYNCVHGVGHGIMGLLRDELFESLVYCDQLTGEWEQRACSQGVFMENIISEQSGHPTNYLRPSEPFYPCTEVPERYKFACYGMQTSYVLQVVGGDFSKVFSLCDGVENAYRNVCFSSLGRDISGRTLSQIEPTRTACMLGKTSEQQASCIVGAVKDYISYFDSDVQARQLCASLANIELRTTCEQTVKEYYAYFR